MPATRTRITRDVRGRTNERPNGKSIGTAGVLAQYSAILMRRTVVAICRDWRGGVGGAKEGQGSGIVRENPMKLWHNKQLLPYIVGMARRQGGNCICGISIKYMLDTINPFNLVVLREFRIIIVAIVLRRLLMLFKSNLDCVSRRDSSWQMLRIFSCIVVLLSFEMRS